MARDLPTAISERLDKLYVCKECRACYIFQSDIAEHQKMSGHDKGFDEIGF